MEDVLTPDGTLPVDSIGSLTVEEIFKHKLWALYTTQDMLKATRAKAVSVVMWTNQ